MKEPKKPAFDKVDQLCSLVNGILKREKEMLERIKALEDKMRKAK